MKQSKIGWHPVMGLAFLSYLLSALILVPLFLILGYLLLAEIAYLLNLWDLRSTPNVTPLSMLIEAFDFRVYLRFLQTFSMHGIVLWTIGGTLWNVLWWIRTHAFGRVVRRLFWAYASGLCMGCAWLFLGVQGFDWRTLLVALMFLPAFVLSQMFISCLRRVYNWLAVTDFEFLWWR